MIKKVIKGKTSIDHIPCEFGNEVEIIVLPVKNIKSKTRRKPRKRLSDLAGKTNVSSDVLMELENGRQEDRF